MVNRYCSAGGAHHVTLVKDLLIHEKAKDNQIVTTINRKYLNSLWHRYSIAVHQVMKVTILSLKW